MKKTNLVKIDLLDYEDGMIRFDNEIRDTTGSGSNTTSYSIIGSVIEVLAETGYITHKEAEVYSRIHEDHLEVIDLVVVEKIKEALKFGDKVKDFYYKK